jgi:peptidoglycan/LPS O-acetylase OafA/YrhL
VWLAKAHELAPVFAACSAVAFLLFVCSRSRPASDDDARGAYIRRCADALGRESYGIYLWHFICVYATLHFFEGVFGQSGRETSLVLFVATVLAVLAASYVLSRVSDRMIQGRATRSIAQHPRTCRPALSPEWPSMTISTRCSCCCAASLICSGDRSISTAPDYDGPPASALTLRDVLRSSLMYRFAATIPKTM